MGVGEGGGNHVHGPRALLDVGLLVAPSFRLVFHDTALSLSLVLLLRLSGRRLDLSSHPCLRVVGLALAMAL